MKKINTILILIFICLCSQAQHMTVATYNIRLYSKSDAEKGNGWEHRFPALSQLILYNDFDIFGAQEVVYNQLEDLLAVLTKYNHIGVGRDDGLKKGECSPIFYKRDKYNLLQSGTFWLSENTDYPNIGWDAALPRICTWGEFENKEDGYKFWFFNLHMDHRGVNARKESAKLVLKKIKEMCGSDPVILTGDFNVDQNNESYKLLNNSDILDDSYEVASFKYALNGTFNNFDPNLTTESRIDHIFVSPAFTVKKYAILTDTYRSPKEGGAVVNSTNFPKEVSLKEYIARVPSDHFPVRVDLMYNK